MTRDPHPRSRRRSVLPIHGRVAFQFAQQLMRDDPKLVVPHQLHSALVLGQGVIERDFLLAQSFLFSAAVRGADVLRELDQLLKDLRRRDGTGVVAGDRLLEPIGEGPGLDNVDT